MYIIGIDGGGTKTEAILYQVNIGVLDCLQEKASNPHSTSFERSVDRVVSMIIKLLTTNKINRSEQIHVCFGIAGLGRRNDRQKWQEIFKHKLPDSLILGEVLIETDALIALYSGTYGSEGIVSICGTGSITYGVNNGKTLRVGGWGHLIGAEPGSGFYIGYRGLEATFNQIDGLAKSTAIASKLLKGENIREPSQLIQQIYGNSNEKEKIANMAKYVFQAAEEGDPVANTIIEDAAFHIIKSGNTLYKKFNIPFSVADQMVYVLVGGLFKNKLLVQKVTQGFNGNNNLKITVSKNKPVMGAIIAILKKKCSSTVDIKKIINIQG
ncbi:N-acetylglucosamine kinase [Pseudogracilibacillus sp. SO30301A]|uniref:N-acetylglucosamine kinase n=1 Tax=Pseudogracilibacillus sp. SO30301A TaxID=3098291 RepID=UPI00300E3ED6